MIYSLTIEARKEANETMWYGKVDGFINEINRIALLNEVTPENKWLVNNGMLLC